MSNEIVNNTLASTSGMGNFDVGTTASVQDIALAVGLEQMECYDQQVTTYYGLVHQGIINQTNLNNAMAAANSAAPNGTNNSTSSVTFTYTDPQTGVTSTKSVASFMDGYSPTISRPSDPDNKYSTDEWNTVVSNLKTELDDAGNQSQEDNMKMQSILNKQQEAQAAATSIMKKADDANMSNIEKW